MKSLKKLIAMGLVAALSVSLVACGPAEKKGGEGGDKKPEGKKKIEVIAKGFQHQFWKAVNAGADKAAKEFNVEITFQGPDNESAIAQQTEFKYCY